MSSAELLDKRFSEHAEFYSRLPSMGHYYPTLSSPSRGTVTLRFREQHLSRRFINFSSSNYLSINRRPEVKEACFVAYERFGSGANGSPVLSGFYEPHQELEEALTRLHGTEDTVLFSSGYCANLSLLAACLGPKDLLVFDEAIHGSIIDGARLAQTRMRSFAHNDAEDLGRVLERFREQSEVVVVATLGVFSMSGSIAPLPRIIEQARKHDALVMLDEAHAVGVLGESGRGTLEHFGLPPSAVDFCVGTLSKTLAGMGGYVTGSRKVAAHLRFAARPHILSAAIPPPTAAACAAAVHILENEGRELSRELRTKAESFRGRLTKHGIELLGEGTGVAAFSVQDFDALWRATNHLFERGVFLNPVLYPAVRRNEGRMRYYLNSEHTEEELSFAAEETCRAVSEFAGAELRRAG